MGEIAETLQGAYDALERYGWCQDHHVNPAGQLCLEAAIHAGAGPTVRVLPLSGECEGALCAHTLEGYQRADRAMAYLRDTLFDQSEGAAYSLFEWNDRPERTVEDVKLLLKRGIEQAQEVGV